LWRREGGRTRQQLQQTQLHQQNHPSFLTPLLPPLLLLLLLLLLLAAATKRHSPYYS